MNLVELYVDEVGQRLPDKLREDIQKEIRSLIEDALEDESRAQGRAPDEEMAAVVLERLGPPQKVAASYLPPRYLIGPQLYPYFINTARIVLPIVVILAMVGLGVSLGSSTSPSMDIGEVMAQIISDLLGAVIQAMGMIVLVFAILQWTMPEFKLRERGWDPRKMKAAPDPERVRFAKAITDLFFTVAGLVVFNLYPQWISFSRIQGGQWVHAPLLTAAFFQYLPWLSLLWALEICLYTLQIAQGHWSALTRWLAVGLNLFTIGLAARMLVGPAIVGLDPAALSAVGFAITDPQAIQLLGVALANSARVVLGIVLIVNAIRLVRNLYRLLLRGRLSTALG